MKPLGFTLVELLVSLAIVSFALLALHNMQVRAVQSYKQDLAAASAQQLSQDLLERIRANTQAISAYQTYLREAPDSSSCELHSCDARQLAAYDMWQWHQLKKHQRGFIQNEAMCLSISNHWLTLQWDWSLDDFQEPSCEQAILRKDVFLLEQG